jgi:hypothetical protein
MTTHFSNLRYDEDESREKINAYFAKQREQERLERERLEREAQEKENKDNNKNKAGENLEKKAEDNSTNPIINPTNPNSNLSFVTDAHLYNEIIKYLDTQFSNYKDILSQKLSFDADNEIMKGSNTYIATAIDMFLKKEIPEYRIARQIDLEQNLQMFRGFYIDSGLALRNLTNSTNNSKAIHLFNQLKQKGLTEQDFPIWFNLQGLELDNNLNFNLTDESLYKTAECLNWKNRTRYSVIDDFGLPEKENKSSSRQIWINDNALSGFDLGRASDLLSGNDDLAGSFDNGRVVLVRAVGSSQKNSGGSK